MFYISNKGNIMSANRKNSFLLYIIFNLDSSLLCQKAEIQNHSFLRVYTPCHFVRYVYRTFSPCANKPLLLLLLRCMER